MLYLTCTTITSVDLAHYGVSRSKDSVSVDCGTSIYLDALIRRALFEFCNDREENAHLKRARVEVLHGPSMFVIAKIYGVLCQAKCTIGLQS